MIIDWNGSLVEERQAVVSVYDHGFLYGMGLFETFRTYGGRPFLLDWHIERMMEGCAELEFRHVPDKKALEHRITALLQANGLEDGYFRYTVTAGTDALGLPTGAYAEPNELIYIKPLPPMDAGLYQRGKAIQQLKLRRSTPEGAFRLKSLHYMNNILAKKEMRSYPWAAGAEGVFLDAAGHLCEGIVSNLFFVRDGVLHTPSEDCGMLPGITRRFVLKEAPVLGLSVKEGQYGWEQLLEADELFLTSSIQELVPVTNVYDTEGQAVVIGGEKIGTVTEALLRRYRSAAMNGYSTASSREGTLK